MWLFNAIFNASMISVNFRFVFGPARSWNDEIPKKGTGHDNIIFNAKGNQENIICRCIESRNHDWNCYVENPTLMINIDEWPIRNQIWNVERGHRLFHGPDWSSTQNLLPNEKTKNWKLQFLNPRSRNQNLQSWQFFALGPIHWNNSTPPPHPYKCVELNASINVWKIERLEKHDNHCYNANCRRDPLTGRS